MIKNKENYGFAEGNNIGIRFSLNNLDPDYILLLNNDTVVEKNFLDELVKNGENNKEIGILGPKIYLYDKPRCNLECRMQNILEIKPGDTNRHQ
ncbi:glycosyltransferase [uncultured Methanobacterium sp.]|uniref:glycosyltransferase n=1 Tax=uncultured Methanobacterium sp. TaxID=176306 RepID=UPI002AA895B8|nr:glycosyltransferase [uncultured Methanobacterium sp.]